MSSTTAGIVSGVAVGLAGFAVTPGRGLVAPAGPSNDGEPVTPSATAAPKTTAAPVSTPAAIFHVKDHCLGAAWEPRATAVAPEPERAGTAEVNPTPVTRGKSAARIADWTSLRSSN